MDTASWLRPNRYTHTNKSNFNRQVNTKNESYECILSRGQKYGSSDEWKIKANAIWKTHQKYRTINEQRNSRKTLLCDNITQTAPLCKICKAITLSNNPCKFKATCGDFCKKHQC